MQMCSAMDQPWRSAALRGAKAFCWDQLGVSVLCTLLALVFPLNTLFVKVEKESDAMDEDGATKSASFHGNPRRKLWRKACKASATNVS
jgi:hypothetical protein